MQPTTVEAPVFVVRYSYVLVVITSLSNEYVDVPHVKK